MAYATVGNEHTSGWLKTSASYAGLQSLQVYDAAHAKTSLTAQQNIAAALSFYNTV